MFKVIFGFLEDRDPILCFQAMLSPHTTKVSTRVWLLIDKSALFPHPSQDPEPKKGLRIF